MAVAMLLLSVLFTVVDQFLKLVVVRDVKPVGSVSVIPGLLDWEYVENRGAAFSLLEGGRWVFVAITAAVCVFIIFAMFRYTRHEFFSWAASALVVGGGVGNMIDRILHEYVVDYIRVSFFPAIFNFGDCCVVIGAIFFIIHAVFFSERDTEKVIRRRP